MSPQAAVSRQGNLQLRACHTYLSLGFYFNRNSGAPGGLGHVFCELAEGRSLRVPSVS